MRPMIFLLLMEICFSQNLSTFNQVFYSGISKTGRSISNWYNPLIKVNNQKIFISYSKFNHGADFSDYSISTTGNYINELSYFLGYRENKIVSNEISLIKESWIRTSIAYDFNIVRAAITGNYFIRNWEIIEYKQNYFRTDVAAFYSYKNFNFSVIYENLNQKKEFEQLLIFSISYQNELLALSYSQFSESEFSVEYEFSSEVYGLVKFDLFKDRIDYSLGFQVNINLLSFSYFYEIQSIDLIDNKQQLILSVDL